MREAVKRIILRMFPELSGGYHLDRYARILKISDPPAEGVICNRFRPYWAADIEIMTPEGTPAPGFPKYEAVPLPVLAAGPDEGFFLWPRPGTIVTVRWIEGRPDHPVIQHVYPMGLSLPAVPDDMGRWQQRPGVHQTVDPDSNWERKTDKDIHDAAGNEKSTTAKVYRITAPTIVMGAPNGGPSVLPLITSALANIKDALDILATHTHPSVGTCSQSASISAKATAVGTANTSLGTLKE
jgi:hypothetical protein